MMIMMMLVIVIMTVMIMMMLVIAMTIGFMMLGQSYDGGPCLQRGDAEADF